MSSFYLQSSRTVLHGSESLGTPSSMPSENVPAPYSAPPSDSDVFSATSSSAHQNPNTIADALRDLTLTNSPTPPRRTSNTREAIRTPYRLSPPPPRRLSSYYQLSANMHILDDIQSRRDSAHAELMASMYSLNRIQRHYSRARARRSRSPRRCFGSSPPPGEENSLRYRRRDDVRRRDMRVDDMFVGPQELSDAAVLAGYGYQDRRSPALRPRDRGVTRVRAANRRLAIERAIAVGRRGAIERARATVERAMSGLRLERANAEGGEEDRGRGEEELEEDEELDWDSLP